jgi:hypothetical protein
MTMRIGVIAHEPFGSGIIDGGLRRDLGEDCEDQQEHDNPLFRDYRVTKSGGLSQRR